MLTPGYLLRLVMREAGLALFLILIIGCQALLPATPPRAPTPRIVPSSDTPIPYPTSTFVEAVPTAPLNLRGQFVFSPGDGSLWLQDIANGTTTALAERSLKELSQLPAFAPDGKQIAYATLVFLPGGIVRGDLRAMDLPGRTVRTVIQAERPNVFYFYPRWSSDGKNLLITRATNLQTLDERADLEMVTFGGSAQSRVLVTNARDGDISKDGKQITFVRTSADGTRNSLWLANADGSAPKALVSEGTFPAIMSPRFSPDGQWLAFSVHGTPLKPLPWAYRRESSVAASRSQEQDSCFLSLLFTCLIQTASAHGAPGAVWRVNLKTSKFEELTPIYADSPTPAWAADGSAIAIQDVSTIRLIDLQRKAIYALDEKHGGTGGFDWRDKGY